MSGWRAKEEKERGRPQKKSTQEEITTKEEKGREEERESKAEQTNGKKRENIGAAPRVATIMTKGDDSHLS